MNLDSFSDYQGEMSITNYLPYKDKFPNPYCTWKFIKLHDFTVDLLLKFMERKCL